MDHDLLTLGFARRATEYKRANLIFSDIQRLKNINKKRKVQFVFAGKAHKDDDRGKRVIQEIACYIESLKGEIEIAYLEDYDIGLAEKIVPGVDVWLNTPSPPLEASGTSGMKAAHNGVPQFGTLDGWWLEGCIENITGWSIGGEKTEEQESDDNADRQDLFAKLEDWIMPKYYNDRDNWIRTMRSCIAINASFFNTNRMIQQYVLNAYFR